MPTAGSEIPHPDYGLDHSTRLLVLQDAEVMGVKAAALTHSVSVASVYIWRRRYDFTAHHETKRKEN
jgi:hypothetical protein